jgi:hypothetical protein
MDFINGEHEYEHKHIQNYKKMGSTPGNWWMH